MANEYVGTSGLKQLKVNKQDLSCAKQGNKKDVTACF